MSVTTINLHEGINTFYLYQVKVVKNTMNLKIIETPIRMEKWRIINTNRKKETETDVYKPLPNQTPRGFQIPVSELGKIFHGTNMILNYRDMKYYKESLMKEYQQRCDTAKKNVERYENYIEYLLTEIE